MKKIITKTQSQARRAAHIDIRIAQNHINEALVHLNCSEAERNELEMIRVRLSEFEIKLKQKI